MPNLKLTALVVAAGLPLAACATDKPKAATSKQVAAVQAPKVAETIKADVSVKVDGPSAPSAPIYFAFDSDQLTDESQGVLKQMAAFLAANPGAKLTIEGHCDESGSNEYNLALGDRRARAAREYLEALGVPDARLNSISFGEEKPAVAGTDDAAQAKNRRGQFDLKG